MHTALLGLAGFVLYAIFGVILLGTDRPLATVGRAAQSLWNKVTRGRRPVTGLDQRLLAERDTIRAVLGRKWRQAIVLTASASTTAACWPRCAPPEPARGRPWCCWPTPPRILALRFADPAWSENPAFFACGRAIWARRSW